MELSLKLTLTDEQYQDLMNRSFETLMDSPQVHSELQRIVMENVGEHIKHWVDSNANNWICEIYNIDRWRTSAEHKEFTTKLVKEAGAEYTDKVKEIITSHMMDMVQKVPVGEIVYKILLDGIMRGVTGGLHEWADMVAINNGTIQQNFDLVKEALSRIGANDVSDRMSPIITTSL